MANDVELEPFPFTSFYLKTGCRLSYAYLFISSPGVLEYFASLSLPSLLKYSNRCLHSSIYTRALLTWEQWKRHETALEPRTSAISRERSKFWSFSKSAAFFGRCLQQNRLSLYIFCRDGRISSSLKNPYIEIYFPKISSKPLYSNLSLLFF